MNNFTDHKFEQPDLFNKKRLHQKSPHFNGPDYIPKLDQKRLSNQHEQIKNLMIDHKWRTLGEIENELNYPQASISAQLRHLRKERFGGFTLQKQRRKLAGLFEYRIL